jgi:hypothetical protein
MSLLLIFGNGRNRELTRRLAPTGQPLLMHALQFYGRRSYSNRPGIDLGEQGGDSGVGGNAKIEASGEVEAVRWSSV